jgi:hypothetical protein
MRAAAFPARISTGVSTPLSGRYRRRIWPQPAAAAVSARIERNRIAE